MREIIKICIISTLDHNIGDDFVRLGIIRLVNQNLGNREVEINVINKHAPLMVFQRNWVNGLQELILRLPRGKYKVTLFFYKLLSIFLSNPSKESDVIIQSGAPVIHPGLSKTEWAKIIYRDLFIQNNRSLKMNIAAGSCFSTKAKNIDEAISDLTEEDIMFLRKLLDSTDIFTVRDELAQQIVSRLGHEADVVGCTASLAFEGHKLKKVTTRKILLNYMTNGGHYTFGDGQIVQKNKAIIDFVLQQTDKHDVAFFCHTAAEYSLVSKVFPTFDVYYPTTQSEYLEMMTNAAMVISNRLHACIVAESLGVAACGVVNDTRMLMLKQFGIETVDLNQDLHIINHGLLSFIERSTQKAKMALDTTNIKMQYQEHFGNI